MKELAKAVVLKTAPVWDTLYIQYYKAVHGHPHPIPPFSNRRRIGTKWISGFLNGGEKAFDALRKEIIEFQDRPLNELTCHDFGCGCGRIARWAYPHFKEFHATDIDGTAIAFLQRGFPKIKAQVNGFNPPLPLEDESLDVVYSWSIWTHLATDMQEPWLEEMLRVLKPGGLFLPTVNGLPFFRHIKPRLDLREEWRNVTEEDLAKEGLLYRNYAYLGKDKELLQGVEGDYGLTFHDVGYLKDRWSRYFEILAVREGAMHNVQDLVVARKPR